MRKEICIFKKENQTVMCFRVQLASDFSRRDVRDFCVNTSTTRQVCSLQCSKTIFMRDDLKIDHEIIKILR